LEMRKPIAADRHQFAIDHCSVLYGL